MAFGDIDNDGHVDTVVSRVGRTRCKLFRNVSGRQPLDILNWSRNKKQQNGHRRTRYASVTEDGRPQWNEVTTAVGYASSSDSRVHFGLGSNRQIKEIEIHWPSGNQTSASRRRC